MINQDEIESLLVNIDEDRKIEDKINSVIIPIIKTFIYTLPDDTDMDDIGNIFGKYRTEISVNVVDILRKFKVLKDNLTLRFIRLHIIPQKGIFVDYSIIDIEKDNDRLFSVEIV